MSEYLIGQDMNEVKRVIEEHRVLIEQLYAIIDYNIKKGTLEEPKEKK